MFFEVEGCILILKRNVPNSGLSKSVGVHAGRDRDDSGPRGTREQCARAAARMIQHRLGHFTQISHFLNI